MLNWQLKRFDELSTHTLYALLRLRTEVFVVEQDCPFQDMDNQDQDALHLFARQGDESSNIIAYLRILTSKDTTNQMEIGRVITSESARGHGYGRELMLKGIETVETHFPQQSIYLSAQQRLHELYAGLGFKVVSEPYLEDGITHVAMLKTAKPVED